MEKETIDLSRRNFMKISFVTGMGLVVGCRISAHGSSESATSTGRIGEGGVFIPNAWIRINPDDFVTIMIHHSEMGQGITTALSMIVAEELDADWSKVRAEMAPVARVYKNPAYKVQYTGGSTSVKTSWDVLRKAGAATRENLISTAANRWKVPVSQCRSQKGTVIHTHSQRSLRYGQLLEEAAALPVPKEVRLKKANEFSIIGKRLHRLDSETKTLGKPLFGIDKRIQGLLTATVVHPPVLGAKLKSLDDNGARNMPGVRRILPIESGVAVVAETFWEAENASRILKAKWKMNGLSKLSTDKIMAQWTDRINEKGERVREDGNVNEAISKSAMKLEANYQLPYQAHACPEPMNCTAYVRQDACDIWVPTQAQDVAREVASDITGFNLDAVKIHTTFIGGGYGRRNMQDYVAEAVQISKELKHPVKVIWTREEDIRNDYYRPAFYNRVEAGLNEAGFPIAWRHRAIGPAIYDTLAPLFGPSVLPEWLPGTIKHGLSNVVSRVIRRFNSAKHTMRGSKDMTYNIENIQIDYINDDPGVPIGPWRSVAYSRNAFVVESFIDEIAAVSERDPYELRDKLLENNPREQRVLRLAADKAGWGSKLPEGLYQGIAIHAPHESYVAMVAEVSVEEGGQIKVHRVVCAVDCGVAVNPKIIEAQMVGGVAFGLTATLKSAVSIKDGRVQQTNFDDFPILRMDEMPKVEVHIVKSNHHPTGIGEVGVPTVAPAVTNAIFAATGKRIRKIPVDPGDLVS